MYLSKLCQQHRAVSFMWGVRLQQYLTVAAAPLHQEVLQGEMHGACMKMVVVVEGMHGMVG